MYVETEYILQSCKILQHNILALRIKYKEKRDVFSEDSIERKEPMGLFEKWFQEALNTPEILEPNAMCLATATKYKF